MRAIVSRRCSIPLVSAHTSFRALGAKPVREVRVRAEKTQATPSGQDDGTAAQPDIDEDLQKDIEALKANEASAARPTPAEHLRTLVELAKFGTISTLACSGPTKGYPSGAIFPYATDDRGGIICALSNLSGHKRDLAADGRATVTVTQDGFKNMEDARGSVTGKFETVPEEQRAAVRDAYMQVHPDAFWVDFGDFDFLRMTEVAGCNLISGFGRAFQIPAEEYAAAVPDPVAQFSKAICQHINERHADSTAAMVAHYVGMEVEAARMLSVDRLGISTQCRPKRAPTGQVNIRLAFPEPAETRGAVKEQLVAMTRAAAAAAQASGA